MIATIQLNWFPMRNIFVWLILIWLLCVRVRYVKQSDQTQYDQKSNEAEHFVNYFTVFPVNESTAVRPCASVSFCETGSNEQILNYKKR